MRDIAATFLLIAYQIVMIVVFFNLLIAIMNVTIQKYQDRRQLYWKFARTSVWIEYFDDTSALPLPFTIFNVVWSIIYIIAIALKWIYLKIKIITGREGEVEKY